MLGQAHNNISRQEPQGGGGRGSVTPGQGKRLADRKKKKIFFLTVRIPTPDATTLLTGYIS